MSLDSLIHTLSNINAIGESTANYFAYKNAGVPAGEALANMGYSIMNGAWRNAAAKEIRHNTGSYMGYAINNAAGYGTPEANYVGTYNTMNALMFSEIFSPRHCHDNIFTSSLYGCGPYGGGYFNGGYFGGGYFGGCGYPSMFSLRGCWC